jgi:hypothetical protein
MELGSQRHCVDHHRRFIWVIVEDHDFEQAAGPVRADHEVPAGSWYYP